MYELKEDTKRLVAKILGMDYSLYIGMDYDEEETYIKKISNNKTAFYPKNNELIIGRGNPLLAREEFLTIDEVNKGLQE